MQKLLNGIMDFRRRVLPQKRAQFAELAKGQTPDVLFVTCSDSRVAPNWFASTDPGDLFVVRNVGNLIPPHNASEFSESSVIAAAEFALLQLKVSHIVICGHSECGAMNALCSGHPIGNDLPHMKSWLRHAHSSLEVFKGSALDSGLTPVNALSRINVHQQIEHLKTHPFIAQALDRKILQIHGWWFDIATASVFEFDEKRRDFKVIE